MQEQDQSYLDLSVLPGLREFLLSPHAVVLFRKDLRNILWANANGAKLFGGHGVDDLLDTEISDDLAIVRQLRSTASQLRDGTPLVRGFRINQGARSILIQFEVRRLFLTTEDYGYLVKAYADGAEEGQPTEHDLAVQTVKSLDGFADAAAILDEFGIPIAASSSFEALGPDDETMSLLAEELETEEDRLIKRAVTSVSGSMIAAGLGMYADNPTRSLLVLAQTDEVDGTMPEAVVAATSTDEPEGAVQDDEADDDTSPSDGEQLPSEQNVAEASDPEEPVQQESTDEDGVASEFEDSGATDFEPEEADETDELEDEISTTDLDDGDEEDQSEVDADDTEADAIADEIGSNPQVDGNFLYFNEKDDVRFAWSLDRDMVFQSVSPELGRTVGPEAADLVGQTWTDVASRFGFDQNGDIAKKFSSQDTWSGKSVLWPVQGTDMVVPVDLAALPVFGADRAFEGFKGFGIIRTVDAIVDPDAVGIALVSSEAGEEMERPEEPDDLMEDEPTIFWNTGDDDTEEQTPEEIRQQPDDRESSTDEHRADESTTNVVRLVPKAEKATVHALSEKENTAFRKIAETLGEEDRSDETENTADQNQGAHLDTSLMAKLPVAVLVYRTDEILFANSRLFRATGYETIEELADAGGVDALLSVDELEASDSPAKQYLATKGGDRVPVSPVLQTVPWQGEKALLLSFPASDSVYIDEPMALEITASSEIQNILDTATDGIILMEPSGKIVSINASAEALFGTTYEEKAGTPFAELFAPESQETVHQYIESLSGPGVERLLNDGREVIAEERNGGLIPIFLTVSRMETSDKLCAVIRDMTSWKKVEEELIQSRREAIKASEQKTDFLAHVSHEIRTPLNAIIGFSDVMLEEKFGPIDNQRYREYLRDINRSGSHVLELVNDLLDLSKIEAGKLELSFEAVELNQIVAETVALLQPQANSNRIIIRTSLSRAVPKVVADPRSIRQIILNLVSNAIKFSPANSQVIVSTLYESNGEVAMRVRDTGDGMSEREIEEALKPFHQLHQISERAGEGTGLGLPLTKALVEANRALFDIESEPGVGTIAHVQFPTQRVLAD